MALTMKVSVLLFLTTLLKLSMSRVFRSEPEFSLPILKISPDDLTSFQPPAPSTDHFQDSRIIGGKSCTSSSICALITNYSGTLYICSGSVVRIDPHWGPNNVIVTAGHCCPSGKQKPDWMKAYCGTKMNWRYPNGSINYNGLEVGNITQHPDFKITENSMMGLTAIDSDICGVQLKPNVAFDDTTRTILLPPPNETKEPRSFIAAGWGLDSVSQHTFPYTPKCGDMNLAVCGATPKNKAKDTMCFEGPDACICGGDSGGPVYTVGSNKMSCLIGVNSYGQSDCAIGSTSGATRVANYTEWLRTTFSLHGELLCS